LEPLLRGIKPLFPPLPVPLAPLPACPRSRPAAVPTRVRARRTGRRLRDERVGRPRALPQGLRRPAPLRGRALGVVAPAPAPSPPPPYCCPYPCPSCTLTHSLPTVAPTRVPSSVPPGVLDRRPRPSSADFPHARARRRFRADTGREEAAGPAVLGENGWGVVPGREGHRLSVAVRFVDNEGAVR